MKRILVASILGVLCLSYAGAAQAVTAVIEINEAPWYTANKNGYLGGASLTRWYAPLPVFFEGWKSSVRADIVEYRWDFGDGSPNYIGFNAAHVYEQPGVYTASLTVKDGAGATNTATVTIEALARTGKRVIYVDALQGNDANPGTSPGTGAWRTADKVFAGLATNFYKPGDQVLFTRGQTYDVTAGQVVCGAWKMGSGWLFGAYGTGEKPVIKLQGVVGTTNAVIYGNGVGLGHATFQDLVFDLTSPTGQRCDFFYESADLHDLLFLRVDIQHMGQGITLPGGMTDRIQSGVFIVGCTMYDSSWVSNHAKCSRYALLNNTFDLSGNHINYLSYLNCAVIAGNTFSRPAFGRAALRIDGQAAATPTNNIQVSDNHITGWIDPIGEPSGAHNGGGTRYNFHLIYFAPNAPTEQVIEHVVFERNTVADAERLMWIGDYEDLVIRNNTFSTVDSQPDVSRIIFGHHFELRPLKDIYFVNNIIESNEARQGAIGVLAINSYTGPAYPLRTLHENIVIKDNVMVMKGAPDQGRYLFFNQDDAPQRAQVTSDNNVIYSNNDVDLAQIAGDWSTPGTLYSLPNWKTFSGQDANTVVRPFAQVPLAGTMTVAPFSSTMPVTLTYSGIQDKSGTGLTGVYLWVKKGHDVWQKSTLSSTAMSGTFNFNDIAGNDTYYFALQVEDKAAHLSAPPYTFGQANTVYGIADTTAPSPGIATAPATAFGSIPVTYTGAGDGPTGSGLVEVRLWVKKGAGAWQETTFAQPGGSGTLNYTDMVGDDTYYFATRALDRAGNTSATPSGNGMTSCVYTTPPLVEVLYDKFDDTPSDGVLDSSAAANNGTCSGTGFPALIAGGKVDGAYTFDGVDDFINVNVLNKSVTKEFTVSAWVNLPGIYTAAATRCGMLLGINTSAGGNVMVLGLGDKALAANDNKITVVDGSTNTLKLSSSAVVADGAWHHIVYTSDGINGRIYVDGVLSGSGSIGYVLSTTDKWSVGQEYDAAATSDFLKGTVDELRIWPGVLSATQIANVFSGSGGGAPTPDTTAPTPGTVSVMPALNAFPFPVTYSGAADTGGSGLKEVRLWVKPGAGAWVDTGMLSAGAAGVFDFSDVVGEGPYAFEVQAADTAGNLSPAPSGSGQATAIYDASVPVAPTLSGSATTKTSPIAVNYAGAADAVSGINSVSLWVRKGAGAWADSGLVQTAAAGTFTYAAPGDGTYYFAAYVVDNAGNTSAAPSGNGALTVTLDATAPTAAIVTVPARAKASPIALTYSGAVDAGSGLKKVSLWVRKDTGAWADSTLSQTTASGSFNYTGMTGDGVYYFATQVTDNQNNVSAAPSGNGDGNTVYDTTAPAAGSSTSKSSTKSSPISVSYTGASDAGSGLKNVHLWVKFGTGAWADSGLMLSGGAGTFDYAVTQNGTYYFATLADDNAGNVSAQPSGNGATSTIYDTVQPTKGTTGKAGPKAAVPGPSYVSTSPITITYSGAADTGSGLKQISLWVKKAPGSWIATGMSQTTGSGSFDYTVMTGDGTYSFATVAEDNAGNATSAPSGDGDLTVVYDTSAPTAAIASAPASTKQSPITVAYSGAADSGSGVQLVTLWVREDAGTWAATTLTSASASGSFDYAPTGDGKYAFATQTTDNAGSVSPTPSGAGDSTTVFDTAAPTIGGLTAPATDSAPPISVAYSGVSDGAGSGVKSVSLWYKKGSGVWANSGMTSTGTSGSFFFSGMSGNDTYHFDLQAEDWAGNISLAPSGSSLGLGNTVFDTRFSAGMANSPAYASAAPVTVTYSGAQDTLDGGIKVVRLWFKKSDAGTWTDSGLSGTAADGSFSFSGFTGDDIYYFALQAENNTGGLTEAPSGNGDTATILDTTLPDAGTVTAPKYAKAAPITVSYTGVSDAGSGLKQLTLWVKHGFAGAWENTGQTSTTAPDGSFDFAAVTVNEQVFFYLQAEDNAGLKTPDPTDEIVFGTTPPAP